ncbi:phosphatase PAP2 family protein [Deltaproteobacteria bacterium]|nr:phosphatase PAP2 family protein [Deltaproteobacteria bacterium]
MCSCSRGSRYFIKPIPFLIVFIILSFFLTIVNGCGTLPNGRGWGQDATLNPGWHRMKEAALKTSLSPETWAPIVTAIVLQVDDMDERLSDWASTNTPIFGSQKDADRWSSYLRDTSGATYLITSLATPGGSEPSLWAESKLKGLATGVAAWGITAGTTDLLKESTHRTRPDKSDNRSLPSGHASTAGAFSTLARRNIQAMSLSPNSNTFANIGLMSITAGTAWARIEARRHYPSDVLIGYALGHFFSAFINDAFLGLDMKKEAFFIIEPSRDGMTASLHWAY